MRRRGLAAVLTIVSVGLLAGCSVATPYGLRLNSDGTVDTVDCYGMTSGFTVDYRRAGEAPSVESPEWVVALEPGAANDDPVVLRYGRAPEGSTSTTLEDPPDDWIEVWTSVGSAVRGELVEGEWVWRATSRYPWEPEHPCDGVSDDDLVG